MPWVNRNTYSPGKRHWVEGVVRTETMVRTYPNRPEWEYHEFVDRTTTPPLCGMSTRPMTDDGYVSFNHDTGKVGHIIGGLSVKEEVNLLQSNICTYCRKRYIDARPELKAAFDAVRQLRVVG